MHCHHRLLSTTPPVDSCACMQTVTLAHAHAITCWLIFLFDLHEGYHVVRNMHYGIIWGGCADIIATWPDVLAFPIFDILLWLGPACNLLALLCSGWLLAFILCQNA